MTLRLSDVDHRRLSCGVELAVLPIPGRSVAAMEIRLLAGYAYENPEHLGVANVLEEAISKGTIHRDGRALNDAFDEIGASHSSCAGRESLAFSCLCLGEFLPQAIALHAEMIRTPTFPDDACRVAVELAQQSLDAIEDDPGELAKKLLHRRAYGEPLGRHVLGEAETLARIGREQIVAHWKRYFRADRMLISVAGTVDAAQVADLLEGAFSSFGEGDGTDLPTSLALRYSGGWVHQPKELEQVQIGICFPGASARDADFPVEQVTVGVLAGGMSGRLFTEVREKQGLVYWVGAWSDQPRRGGMVHVGASCTPENVARTFETLVRELDRLGEDVTQEEIDRAVSGLVTRILTRGEVTRARAGELIDDLFYHGRPRATEEKLARLRAIRVEDVRRYLREHSRTEPAVVTLGPETGAEVPRNGGE